MSLEIERKFRIKMPPKTWLRSRKNLSVTGLVQCYLTARPGWERRVRQATNALTGEVSCTLTEKTAEAGLIRTELEQEISQCEYEALLEEMLPGTPALYKARWAFPYAGHIIEIDCYPFWEEEAILEVELSSPEEAFTLPPEIEVLDDVTDDPSLKNRALALAMSDWETTPPGFPASPQALPRRNDKNLAIPRLPY